MLAATCIAVLLIPVTFYVIEKLASRRKEAGSVSEASSAAGALPAEGAHD